MESDHHLDGTANSKTEPIDASQRLASIDILRGLALFGVLVVNLLTECRVSIVAQFLPATTPPAHLDRVIIQIAHNGHR